MKLKFISLLLIGILAALSVMGCGKDTKVDSDTAKKAVDITLCEVAHSIFYAPMYVAIEEGYFEDEGINLTLYNGNGADNVMNAMIANEADIGFMGCEASVYVYAQGKSDYAVNFAQLTQRAGNFLVGREADEDFKWEDLKGTTVLGGRAGGMPQMVFEYILKKNNIDPVKDLTIDQSVSFGNTAAAFMGNDEYDYTVEFEPFATTLEQEKSGYIVASLGVDSGYVPYTSFCAKKSYLEDNPEIIQAFTDALQKGMDYVQSHSAEEIAEIIAPQFPDNDMESITTIVKRYHDQDSWKDNLVFEEESYNLLIDILKGADQLDSEVPYDKLVDTSFAEKAK